jgi:hypothetical protein
VTKQQLKEIIDAVFAVAGAAVRNPLLKLAVQAAQHVADAEIDAIAARLGVK